MLEKQEIRCCTNRQGLKENTRKEDKDMSKVMSDYFKELLFSKKGA